MDKKEVKATITELIEALNSEDPSSKLPELAKKFTVGDAKAKDKVAKLLMESADKVCSAIVWWLYRGMSYAGESKCYGGSQADPICAWVYDWTQANTPHTQAFVLQLLPAFVWAYYAGYTGLLQQQQGGQEHNFSGVEACLLGVHNLNVQEINRGIYHSPFMHPLLKFDSVYCTGLKEIVEDNSESEDATLAAYKKKLCTPRFVICDGDRNLVICSTLSILIKHFSLLTDKTKVGICKIMKELACLGYPFSSYSGKADDAKEDVLDKFYPGLDIQAFGEEARKMVPKKDEEDEEEGNVIRVRHGEKFLSYVLSLLRLCISSQKLLPLVARACDAIKAVAVYNNYLMAIITTDALIKITENMIAAAKIPSEDNDNVKEEDDESESESESESDEEDKKKVEKKDDKKKKEEKKEEKKPVKGKKKESESESETETSESEESETESESESSESSEEEDKKKKKNDDEKKVEMKPTKGKKVESESESESETESSESESESETSESESSESEESETESESESSENDKKKRKSKSKK